MSARGHGHVSSQVVDTMYFLVYTVLFKMSGSVCHSKIVRISGCKDARMQQGNTISYENDESRPVRGGGVTIPLSSLITSTT